MYQPPMENFELNHKNGKIFVEKISVKGQTLFKVSFSNHQPPLIICRAVAADAEHFWTSVPEGKQRIAEEIGPLIEKYYQSRQ